MKAKTFYLISDQVRDNAIKALNEVVLDGKTKVTIGNAGSKSARQRGLQWQWYTDVSMAGIGGKYEESPHEVSISAKIAFALPMMLADKTDKYNDFIDLFHVAEEARGGDDEFMRYFFDKHCHTEWFSTSEMAEFLNSFLAHYSSIGVNLSDPIDWKLIQSEVTR